MIPGVAYVDGEYVPIAEAKVSILDWGFLHSDATYDVAHVWRGGFFRLDDHLDRFEASLARLRLDPGVPRERMRAVMHECVRRSGLRDAYVEILCTRGLPAPGSRDPRTCANRLMAFAIPFVWIADPDKQRRGVDLHVSDVRRIPASSVDPRVKNYHWLDFVAGLFQAYDAGRESCVLVDEQGCVTEGPGFNVFVVVDGVLVTPRAGVLEGVSRRTVLELARAEGLEASERPLPVAELRGADEVFLSSTGGGVIPVARIDGQAVGGRPAGSFGPVSERLRRGYWALHEDARYVEAVDYPTTA